MAKVPEQKPEQVEDFLDVDDSIPGQKYVLISFISPESTIEQRELFTMNKFLKAIFTKVNEKGLDKVNVMETSADVKQKRGGYRDPDEGYQFPSQFKDFVESYEDFKYTNEDKIKDDFNDMNKNQCSVRGVKVRGVYDDYHTAKVKADRLHKRDRNFHIWVAQVGYWLSWDPTGDPKDIDEVWANEQLNDLMGGYKKNTDAKNKFYQELTEDRIEYAKKEGQVKRDEKGNPLITDSENQNENENQNQNQEPTNDSDNNFKDMVKNIF
jgi:hypothetical protein